MATADLTVAAQSGRAIVKVTETSDGKKILTDLVGRTLYEYGGDTPDSGVSQCTGDCATTWPPVTIQFGDFFQVAGLGLFGQFVRKDGQRQIMYRGWPLYYYSGDKAAGDALGQGKDGRWSIAVP